ncbi:MAG: phytoene desaturase family protein [Verrucomicrobiota bacterium]
MRGREKQIVVVGAGLGGLATALRLQHEGYEVTVLEKNATVGGKLTERRIGSYRWDMGPSLLTMPDVLDELFLSIGKQRRDYLDLVRVEPTCRYFWDDGTVLDEDKHFFSRKDVQAFMRYAKGIYDLSGEAFLMRPPEDFWKAFTPANWPKLIHMPKVATFASVAQEVARRFEDHRLRQLFERFATYNGSSPYKAPATFNVIPYVEVEFGGWYIKGGMVQLARVLEKLCLAAGVTIRCGSQVLKLDEKGVELTGGEILQAEHYVVNGDVIRAHNEWIRVSGWERQAKHLNQPELSLSGFVMFLGVKKQYQELSHHNIFFSSNYQEEFNDLFEEKQFPRDPTVYVNITARTDQQDAPEGCDNFFILVNAPADTKGPEWNKRKDEYAERVYRKLESCGLQGIREQIVESSFFTPNEFANRDVTTEGSLYGWASHSPWTALMRPRIQSPLWRSLYFVGGTTHPGGGIPLVILSSQMVAEKIKRGSHKS